MSGTDRGANLYMHPESNATDSRNRVTPASGHVAQVLGDIASFANPRPTTPGFIQHSNS